MPGADWSAAIVEALDRCRAMVLIFSANANESPQIRNEVARAVHRGIPIIPMRIENIAPVKSLAYFMGAVHWLDALSPPLEQHLQRLVESVKAILKLTAVASGDALAMAPPAADRVPHHAEPSPAPPRSPPLPLARTIAIVVVAALVAGAGAYYALSYWRPFPAERTVSNPTPAAPPAQPAAPPQPQQDSASLAERLLALFNRTIPGMPIESRKLRAQLYAEGARHKAQAVSLLLSGTWRAIERPSEETAEEAALENCQIFSGNPCVLVAIDDRLVPTPLNGTWPLRDMPRVRYAGNFDPDQIPDGWGAYYRNRLDVVNYGAVAGPKAIAYHPASLLVVVTGAKNQRAAEQSALDQCNRDPSRFAEDGSCFLYAVGNQVVLPQRLQRPRS